MPVRSGMRDGLRDSQKQVSEDMHLRVRTIERERQNVQSLQLQEHCSSRSNKLLRSDVLGYPEERTV